MRTLQLAGRPEVSQPTGAARPTSRPIAYAPRWTGEAPRFVDELIGWLHSVGRRTYDGRVTLLEHALQTAALAKMHGAREALVVAALLHDIGRPLADVVGASVGPDPVGSEPPGQRPAGERPAAEHLSGERLAASWLARHYPEPVSEPVRLVVEAKRWLVATEPGYASTLTLASRAALVDQGGPMTPAERPAFEAHPYASAALLLRRWHEEACVPNAHVAPLETYRPALLRQLRTGR